MEQADLTEYDLSRFKRVRFEFLPKSAKTNLLLPRSHPEAPG